MSTETYDWDAIVNGLNQHLRLRSIPIGMKLFETVEEMEAIPKIRRPKARHTTDQIATCLLLKCSTPFGITEAGTHHWANRTIGRFGAQRLSASRRRAPGRRRRPSGSSRVVLNAFRHHGGGHQAEN